MPGTPRDNFIRTRFHRKVYPLEPKPKDFFIDDIVWSLSQQCRFTGHTQGIYSVGQHSCHVHDLVAEWGGNVIERAQAIVHDGSEMALGDMARPLKYAQGDPDLEALGRIFREVEDRVQRAIYQRFDLPEEKLSIVERADKTLLVTEQRDMMGHRPLAGNKGKSLAQYQPLEDRLKIWSERKTRKQMIKRLKTVGIYVPDYVVEGDPVRT